MRKIFYGLMILLFIVMFVSIQEVQGQIETGFCSPPYLQKEIQMWEVVVVGHPISFSGKNVTIDTITSPLDVPDIWTFNVSHKIKGNVSDTIKFNATSDQIILSNVESADTVEILVKDFLNFYNFTDLENHQLVFLNQIIEPSCPFSNKHVYKESTLGKHLTRLVDYLISEKPPSPLKQFKESGGNVGSNFICDGEMVHLKGFSRNNWMCVTPSTAEKLIERGNWLDLGY